MKLIKVLEYIMVKRMKKIILCIIFLVPIVLLAVDDISDKFKDLNR